MFATLCTVIGTILIAATKLYQLSSGQIESSSWTSVARPRHYINEHQTNLDTYAHLLNYGYFTQVYCTTDTFLYSLVLGQSSLIYYLEKRQKRLKNIIRFLQVKPS